MKPITFVTGNDRKLASAQIICKSAGIELSSKNVDIDEIQSDDPEAIIRDKATKAFEVCGGKPIVVVDDSWDIPALNGFPGPYMKYMNQWLKPEDFLRLMDGIHDRRIFMHQYLAYQDEDEQVIFNVTIPGTILTEPRGKSVKEASASIITPDAYGGKTIAEIYEEGISNNLSLYKARGDAWYRFSAWYRQTHN